MALTERLALVIEATAGQAVAEFRKVGAAAKGVEGETGLAKKGLAGLGLSGEAAGGLMKAALVGGAAAIGGALIKMGAEGVKAFVDVTGEIRTFNRISGASAEEGSKMVALFHTLGVSTDDATRGIGMLGKNIDVNAAKLEAHGIVIAKTAAGNVDLVGTLLNVGDAYKATDDPAKRAGLAAVAFGKSWQTLTPILGKSREDIEKIFKAAEGHGLIFSQEQLDKGKEFGIATRELGEAVKGVEVEIGGTLIPVLSDLAIVMTKAADSAHSPGGLVHGMLKLWETISPTAYLLKGVAAGLHALAGEEGDAAKSATELKQAQEEQAKAVEGLNKSLFSLESAHRSVDSAVRAEAAAERDAAEKHAALNKLLRDGAVDEKEVATARKESEKAERDLISSRDDLQKATDSVAVAERILNEAIQPATVEELTAAYDNLKTAQLDAGDAQDSLNEATDKYNKMLAASQAGTSLDPASADELAIAQGDVNDAQAEYNKRLTDGKSSVADVARAHKRWIDTLESQDKLQKRGIVTEDELAKQHEKVERATINLDTAGGRAAKAQDDLNTVLHTGAENDPAVITAREGVATANQHVADATNHVADGIDNVKAKQDALGTALAGDPNYKDEVRAARQAVADATQHVADAEYNVAQNKAKYEEAKKVLDETVAAGGPGAVTAVRTQIEQLLAKKPELAAFFDPVLADLNTAVGLVPQLTSPFEPGTVGAALTGGSGLMSFKLPGKAAGGPISGLTVVGEKGPELFAGHGTIIPNSALGGGGGNTYQITVTAIDPRAASDAVMSAIREYERRSGTAWRN